MQRRGKPRRKFTRGPWELGEDLDLGDGMFQTFVREAEGRGRNICLVYRGQSAVTEQKGKHNANLIAAAPEMYEILVHELRSRTFYSDASLAKLGALLDQIDGHGR